ncbi:SDR family NAD(P)-dependent oxidoreductase [Xanthobacter autotrophicus DSM 431]|uniref:SDR family oxidoreductase n=1 Tax=Xanthobacter nonsaccharivorans TaxID=3119912 RepID=UPI003726E08A
MNTIDLNGRTAVVTGGAGGIGRAIADRLLASGCRVAVWDLNVTAGEREGLVFQQVDVIDEVAVTGAAARAEEVLGGIDILVNNAGITGPTELLERYDYAAWRRTVAVNLDSVFLCSRAVIAGMRARAYGRIVNIASVAGKEANPTMAAYSAAKAGVIGLTKALGRELAETGILVNCVTPGLIGTELLKQMSPEAVAASRSKIPVNRVGEPREVAAMVAWLCSSDCSFTTGAAFDISGGRASY